MKLAAARLMEDKAAQPVQTQMPAVAEPAPTAAPTPAPHPTMPAADPQKTSADKVKDPVCGMTVNQDQATADGLTAEVDGKTYFFCSEDCKEQFKQDPQRFLTDKADKPVHTDAPAHGGHPHD
jgi:Cu+-exporting ATPase